MKLYFENLNSNDIDILRRFADELEGHVRKLTKSITVNAKAISIYSTFDDGIPVIKLFNRVDCENFRLGKGSLFAVDENHLDLYFKRGNEYKAWLQVSLPEHDIEDIDWDEYRFSGNFDNTDLSEEQILNQFLDMFSVRI